MDPRTDEIDPAIEAASKHRRLPSYTGLREIGRGRSGVVYVGRDRDGGKLACKVFDSQGITKVVQIVFLGAPNPYLWCWDAVYCAHLRRRILAELVEAWFGDKLRVARSSACGWNDVLRAFELQAEFVQGRPPGLHHPLRARGDDRLHELADEVLPELQKKLLEAGFDGLVWQAGYGNPVALNNFLFEPGVGPSGRWAWIDLESGVPALAALSPKALFGYYIPRSFRFRRPLFDDVDTKRLAEYVRSDERFTHLADDVVKLERRQKRWKSLSRLERSLRYRIARAQIDEVDARFYRRHVLRWYAKEAGHAAHRVWKAARRLARSAIERLRAIPFGALAVGLGRFLTSHRYRAALARRYVAGRLDAWRRRGQMSKPDADFLREHLDSEESAAWLTDFGVHVAIKPFVKGFEYWVTPALYALGVIDETAVAVILLTAGAVARTLYTAGRTIQNHFRGREKPWVALAVGVVPVLGNFAFPTQLIRSSRAEDDDLARFLLYDGFARIGAHLPIWGGRDTLTEHRLNRLPDRIVRLRGA